MSSLVRADPRKQPLVFKPPTGAPSLTHHTQEWSSGSRGGGHVPGDFTWPSNPKQYQEERGAGDAETEISK